MSRLTSRFQAGGSARAPPWSRSTVDPIRPSLLWFACRWWTGTGNRDFWKGEAEERTRIPTRMVYVSRSFCHKRRVSSAHRWVAWTKSIICSDFAWFFVSFCLEFSVGSTPSRFRFTLTQRIRRCEIAGDMLGHLSWNSSSGTGVRPRIFPHVRNFVNANCVWNRIYIFRLPSGHWYFLTGFDYAFSRIFCGVRSRGTSRHSSVSWSNSPQTFRPLWSVFKCYTRYNPPFSFRFFSKSPIKHRPLLFRAWGNSFERTKRESKFSDTSFHVSIWKIVLLRYFIYRTQRRSILKILFFFF